MESVMIDASMGNKETYLSVSPSIIIARADSYMSITWPNRGFYRLSSETGCLSIPQVCPNNRLYIFGKAHNHINDVIRRVLFFSDYATSSIVCGNQRFQRHDPGHHSRNVASSTTTTIMLLILWAQPLITVMHIQGTMH